MLDFLSLEFASFLYNIEKEEGDLALNLNQIWNGTSEMLQLALDSVNCLNYFCHPLKVSHFCKDLERPFIKILKQLSLESFSFIFVSLSLYDS